MTEFTVEWFDSYQGHVSMDVMAPTEKDAVKKFKKMMPHVDTFEIY